MMYRKYGAQAAYFPMLHARIFSENFKISHRRIQYLQVLHSKKSDTDLHGCVSVSEVYATWYCLLASIWLPFDNYICVHSVLLAGETTEPSLWMTFLLSSPWWKIWQPTLPFPFLAKSDYFQNYKPQ